MVTEFVTMNRSMRAAVSANVRMVSGNNLTLTIIEDMKKITFLSLASKSVLYMSNQTHHYVPYHHPSCREQAAGLKGT